MTTTAPEQFAHQRPIPQENLIPDLNFVNAFTKDKIVSAIIRERAPWAQMQVNALGEKVWDPHVLQIADDAQRYLPELQQLDRIGNEVYRVKFHPAYHELMSLAFGSGVHSLAWTSQEEGSHTARAALSYLWNQVDGSTSCPTGMAYASIPILRSQPEIAHWADKVAAADYDSADVPIEQKRAAHIGYFMTEKHGAPTSEPT